LDKTGILMRFLTLLQKIQTSRKTGGKNTCLTWTIYWYKWLSTCHIYTEKI